MRGLKAKIPRAINMAHTWVIARQYRSRTLFVIAVKKYRGVKNRQPCASEFVVPKVRTENTMTAIRIARARTAKKPQGCKGQWPQAGDGLGVVLSSSSAALAGLYEPLLWRAVFGLMLRKPTPHRHKPTLTILERKC